MRWPKRWAKPPGERWDSRCAGPSPRRCSSYRDPDPLLKAMERVADAREAAWGNVNPQLLLAVLGEELAEVL